MLRFAKMAGGTGVALLVLLSCLPSGAAHPAQIASEQYVRFLSDCSDDWGGHSAVRDGHDLVALDVMERWVPGANEPGFFVMITLAFGYADVGSQRVLLRDDIELGLPGAPLKVRLTTNDNVAYKADPGTGFTVPDFMSPVRPSVYPNGTQDGTRVLVEFGFRYSTLGLKEGAKVATARVQAYAGNDRGDYMPGGYYLLGVDSPDCPYSGSHGGQYSDVLYIRKDYVLRGPEKPYFDLQLGTDTLVSVANATATLPLTIKNKFAKLAQEVSVAAVAPPGWRADSASPSGSTIGPLSALPWEVRLTPLQHPKNGTLRLTVDTDAGGHAERTVPVYSTTTESGGPPTTSSGSSPGLGTALVGLSIVTVALGRKIRP